MTHGTERGTTADGTTQDRMPDGGSGASGTGEAAAVPAPRVPATAGDGDAGAPATDASAPTDGAGSAPRDEATTAGDGRAPAPAEQDGPRPADAPTSGGAPAPAATGTADDARTRPADRARPLRSGPALAAWPSWEDVAVTAPPTTPVEEAPVDEAHDADGERPDRSADDAQAQAADPAATAADAPAQAPPAPEAPAAGAPAEALGEAARRPVPLNLGGLSALAMTALNAAAVGVPAHALARDDARGTADGTDAAASPDTADEDAAAVPDTAAADDATATAAADDATATAAADDGAAAPVEAEDATALGDRAAQETAAVAEPEEVAPDEVASEEVAKDQVTADELAKDQVTADEVVEDESTGNGAALDASTVEATDPAAVTAGADDTASDEAGGTARDAAPADATDSPAVPTADVVAHAPADVVDDTAPTGTPAVPAATPDAAAAGSAAGSAAAATASAPAPADAASTQALAPVEDAAATQALAPVRVPARPGAEDPAATRTWPSTDAGAGSTRPVPGGPVPPTPEAERDPSPLDDFEADEGRRRWPRTLAVVGGVVVLLGGAYVGASYALADRVPRGATVAGVEIGGLTADAARSALTGGLEERTGEALPVVAQDAQAELDPATAGLAFDADATVARLTGVDLAEPVRLWRHLVGVDAQPPVTQVDEDALETALASLSESVRLAPVDGTIVFADGAAHATDAVDGWELDLPAAAQAVEEQWLVGERPLPLPTTPVEPDITQEETQQALTAVAQRLASAPVTVQVADRQATLDVATLTASASMVPVDGALQLQLDGEALTTAVLTQVPDVVTTAADARFEFQGDAPVIVGGEPGTTIDPAALASSVATAVTAEQRLAPVELVQSDPAQTRAALEALGVKEVVSEFSTPLTSEPRRTQNIAAGLENITGTLVRPGETFSLTEALGPVDAAHGFVQAGAIVNGEHTDAWGGGLSQVSTTVFNAAYFAGFEDVEHTPHSEWFQRYPEGREATIFTGVLDMKWKNNTPYGALVQGFVSGGRAHVRIWGTKHFTVETEKSGRSGVVAPTTVYSQSATCSPQSAGNPGFTVTNTRRVFLNGELVDTESDTWRYKPQNKVVCGSAPAPTPTP